MYIYLGYNEPFIESFVLRASKKELEGRLQGSLGNQRGKIVGESEANLYAIITLIGTPLLLTPTEYPWLPNPINCYPYGSTGSVGLWVRFVRFGLEFSSKGSCVNSVRLPVRVWVQGLPEC